MGALVGALRCNSTLDGSGRLDQLHFGEVVWSGWGMYCSHLGESAGRCFERGGLPAHVLIDSTSGR
ncbi:hypothetical protein CSH63_11215 [Micromonospora tulbaghiae]|uniref:Uncharacterized protein n=1 Tax=Micromonospora tulbaghiae TaxID=479978 RepID=A0A386WIU6_9ACTN|nr:hypothetical protein CSH63_11215 [Micromonospora tulbaghiae]